MSTFQWKQIIRRGRSSPLPVVLLWLLLIVLLPCRVSAVDVETFAELEEALLEPCSGAPLTIDLRGSTFSGTANNSMLTIDNLSCHEIILNGHPTSPYIDQTILTPDSPQRVIDFDKLAPGPDGISGVTLNNITILGGSTTGFGGGIFVRPGKKTVTLNNCKIKNNSADASGGGIALSVGTALSLNITAIENNSADFNGGGIFNFGGYVSIDNSSNFSDNSANSGGHPQSLAGNDIFTHTGVIIDTANTSTTLNESGEQETDFSVKLYNPPPPGYTTAIDVTSAELGEVNLSPPALSFTDSNYTGFQNIVVTAVDDVFDDGDRTFNILLTHDVGIDLDGHFIVGAVPMTTIDNDTVGLADAILALQILVGSAGASPAMAVIDVNGDDKIGIAEAVHVLNELAGP